MRPSIIRVRTATIARIASISTPPHQRSLDGPRLHLPQVVSGHVRVPELLLESARWYDLRLSSSSGLQHSARESWPTSTGAISKCRRRHDEADQPSRRRENYHVDHGRLPTTRISQVVFRTHFTEFHRFDEWDCSGDAERVRAEYQRAQEIARLNDVRRARSPRHGRGTSARRGDSRTPAM